MSEYAKRDAEALGEYYTRHVSAMTAEGLHDKADIAAELAHRDKALSAALGHLLNAKIDLETGAPKRTAIATLEGGIRTVRAALARSTGQEM